MNTEWKLVPVEPVDEQQLAGAQAIRMDTTPLNKMFTANRVYRDMIAAAPPAPTSHPIPTGATGEDVRSRVMEVITGVWDRETRIDDAADEVIDMLSPAPAAGDALDAARYRWLRDNILEDHSLPGSFWLSDTGGESWDKTIDAAMDYQRQGDAA